MNALHCIAELSPVFCCLVLVLLWDAVRWVEDARRRNWQQFERLGIPNAPQFSFTSKPLKFSGDFDDEWRDDDEMTRMSVCWVCPAFWLSTLVGGRCLVDAAYWTEVDGQVTTHKALRVKIQCLYVRVMANVVISDQKHVFSIYNMYTWGFVCLLHLFSCKFIVWVV